MEMVVVYFDGCNIFTTNGVSRHVSCRQTVSRHGFWTTVCKTVRPVLSYRCLSCPVCLSVCNVRALWPNGWMNQDETWHAGRPRPRTHCVRWEPSSPSPKGHSHQFSAHICCGQMASWIKMLLGMEVGLGPGDFVLDRDPPPPQKWRGTPQCSAHVNCGQTAGWLKTALGMEVGLSPGDFVLDANQPRPQNGGGACFPFSGPFLL